MQHNKEEAMKKATAPKKKKEKKKKALNQPAAPKEARGGAAAGASVAMGERAEVVAFWRKCRVGCVFGWTPRLVCVCAYRALHNKDTVHNIKHYIIK